MHCHSGAGLACGYIVVIYIRRALIFELMKYHFKRILLLTIFFSIYKLSLSQNASSVYPQNYFRNPLDIPIQLVANFGELRPNHFHMGLDIRTQGRENLPVYAAAEGYISRIKIEQYGYGNAVYVTHPNGYTTLYAHLNIFYPALTDYIKAKQYKEQSWAQDFELPAGLFKVTKGQFIAYSGNTGGSAGPHLHFEIRDTKTGNNLNPQLFGLGITDKQPPVFYKLFWYDRRYSTYQLPGKQIAITKKGTAYTVAGNVVKVNSPVISLGITTEDLNPSTPFKMGIYAATLWMDDSVLNTFKMDDFSYTDTRYLNASIDYSKYIKEKVYVQYLAQLPGNQLKIFDPEVSNGVIIIADTIPHDIKITVKDIYGNTSVLGFKIQLQQPFSNYLFPANAQALLPEHENIVTGKNVKVQFSKQAFYDAVPFVLSESAATNKNSASPMIGLHNYTVPVHDLFSVQIKTSLDANNPLKNNVVMQLTSGRSKETAKGKWTGDWMTASFKKLGTVQLLIDTVPPTITPIGWKNGGILSSAKTLTLKCKDDLDDIDSFSATLDGKWLLFSANNDNYTYLFDEHCTKGLHTLTVKVMDIAGNTTTQNFTFTR